MAPRTLNIRLPQELVAEIDELAASSEPQISRSMWIVTACYERVRRERDAASTSRGKATR